MKKLFLYILAAVLLAALIPVTYGKSVEIEFPDAPVTVKAEIPSSEPEMVYIGEFRVTGYDPYCTHCCSRADGITASGVTVTEGYTVAMCRDFPFGTVIYIEGLGVYEVQDRGVGAGKIDIALGSHAECYAVTGRYPVWVIQ